MSRLAAWLVAALLTMAAISASAQEGISSIQGHVLDQQGGALPGVTVVVTHQESGVFRQVVSNADGSFFVTALTPGNYKVTAELEGFKKYERPNVRLEVGRQASIDVTLEIGSLEESITVTTQAPLLDLTSKEVGGNVSQAELTELPNQTRNALNAVGLMPGVVVSRGSLFASDNISVNGQSNTNNNFMLDGAGNQDDYRGAGYGGQTRTALESVQEFQVLTGQFDAEFGRTTGAVINVVTKSGTNTFQGSAVGVYTDSSITAADFLVRQNNLEKPVSNHIEVAGTLGGPIVKDRAHFFYSLERVILNDPRRNTFAERPELDYATTQETRVWNHLIRFDHQINANNTWGVRHVMEWSPTSNQISGRITLPVKVDEKDLDRTSVITWNSVFSNTRFNTIRASVTYENDGFAPTAHWAGTPMEELPPMLRMLTFDDQISTTAYYGINNAYEFNDTFSWFVPHKLGGEHQLKFGTQYIYSDVKMPNDGNRNGTFSFSTDKPFDPNNPSTYPERFSITVPNGSNLFQKQLTWAVFAQDKWRLNNLTLDLGLRYDLEIMPMDVEFNPLVPRGKYPIDKNNFGPRVGFAWNPGGANNAVVRGGYGMFFERTLLNTVTGFTNPSSSVYSDSFTATFPITAADPGPSRGQLPTDPMLVNGPTVNWALVNQMFPAGSTKRNTATVYLDNLDRATPYVHQTSIGYQRQLTPQLSAGVDFIRSWTRQQLITFNLNPGLRESTSRTGKIVYADYFKIASDLGITPFSSPVLTRRNDGEGRYSGLNFQVEKRFENNWSVRGSYALSYSNGNYNAGNQSDSNSFQLLDDPRYELNEGPTSFTRRHNFTVSGRVQVPRTGGLTVSGTYRWMSGSPFSITDSTFDPDQNGVLFDPLPAGDYCGTGRNAMCVTSAGGRNGAVGPSFQQTDMRFGYRFKIMGKTLDAYADVFNIFNETNWANPEGDRRSGDFLNLTSLFGANGYPRQGQFGLRFAF